MDAHTHFYDAGRFQMAPWPAPEDDSQVRFADKIAAITRAARAV